MTAIWDQIVDSIEEYRNIEHSSDPGNMAKLFAIQQKIVCDRALLADEIQETQKRLGKVRYTILKAKKEISESEDQLPAYKKQEQMRNVSTHSKLEESQERAILDYLLRIYDVSGDVMRAIQQQLAFLRQEWQYNTFNK